jgi:flagellar biosynthesis/type III secretory pathway protein FliH
MISRQVQEGMAFPGGPGEGSGAMVKAWAMGRIVKAATFGLVAHGESRPTNADPRSCPADADARDAVLAQATEVLVSAHLTAEAELMAAKDAAWVLARKMAEKIIGRAVEMDPSVVGEIVGQALAASRAPGGAILVRIHPDDLLAVEQTRPHWLRRMSTASDVRLVGDASVGRYGCVVETAMGRLDARLQSQLDALERAVRGPR